MGLSKRCKSKAKTWAKDDADCINYRGDSRCRLAFIRLNLIKAIKTIPEKKQEELYEYYLCKLCERARVYRGQVPTYNGGVKWM